MKATAGLVVQVASMLLDISASHVSFTALPTIPHSFLTHELLLPFSISNPVASLGISHLLLLLGALLEAHALLPILTNLHNTINNSC